MEQDGSIPRQRGQHDTAVDLSVVGPALRFSRFHVVPDPGTDAKIARLRVELMVCRIGIRIGVHLERGAAFTGKAGVVLLVSGVTALDLGYPPASVYGQSVERTTPPAAGGTGSKLSLNTTVCANAVAHTQPKAVPKTKHFATVNRLEPLMASSSTRPNTSLILPWHYSKTILGGESQGSPPRS
jgi:hypothetical protein